MTKTAKQVTVPVSAVPSIEVASPTITIPERRKTPGVMDASAVAKALGTSKSVVYGLVKRHKLIPNIFGRNFVFLEEDVMTFKASNVPKVVHRWA